MKANDIIDLYCTKFLREWQLQQFFLSARIIWYNGLLIFRKGGILVKTGDDRIFLRALQRQDGEALLALRLRNRSFLQAWEPIRPDSRFTLQGCLEQIESAQREWQQDKAYAFGIFLRDDQRLIGRVALSNVVRGAWQNATIGYFMDEQHNGKGFMTEAVKQAVAFAFTEAGLHRVQAAVMPRNVGSIRVLEKAGFRYEGLSLRYLQINGVWEDHNLYAITREEFC
jgi:ribosomal-protein-alanine N-acetyltransferase